MGGPLLGNKEQQQQQSNPSKQANWEKRVLSGALLYNDPNRTSPDGMKRKKGGAVVIPSPSDATRDRPPSDFAVKDTLLLTSTPSPGNPLEESPTQMTGTGGVGAEEVSDGSDGDLAAGNRRSGSLQSMRERIAADWLSLG
jgi:hypothetical protein